MPGHLSAVAMFFLSLAVILQGHQIRGKAFSQTRDYLQYTSTSTGQTTTKPLRQLTNQTGHVTLAARSRDDHIQVATENSTSENVAHITIRTKIPVTTKILPPSRPVSYTFVIPSNSHVTPSSTKGTIDAGSIAQLPIHTTGAGLSTVNHTAGRTPQLGGQTTLPKTFFTASHNFTTNQKPTPPTYAPGTSVHKDSSTTSHAHIVLGPTLATQSPPAKTGTYEVLNGSSLCIKAEMGIELVVQEKDSDFATQRHFNIDPSFTHASGKCGSQKSNLFLDFKGGSVNVTFIKEKNSYYISEVGAYLTVSNAEETYQGMKHNMRMFETVVGHSFKCVSEQRIQLSAHLQMKTMNVHLQAFYFERDCFGNVDECLSDYTVVLPVVGAIVVILCVVGLGVYKIHQRRQSSGYQSI